MLENIKTLFFIKIIFSYIDEERKLKLSKYNKVLQKKLNLNIISYKIYSGRYIVYESGGKTKEYNYLDDLVFEGEYLKGLRNGKGKEYKSNEIIYEGDYLNGKRDGKGK